MTPFYAQAKTFKIDVTATSSTNIVLPTSDAGTIRLVNDSYSTVFVSIGIGDQTATLPTGTALDTCTPVLGGSDVTFSIPRDKTMKIAAICKSGETSTLYVQVGEGV